MIPCRCLVCGDEYDIEGDRPTSWRDEHTGGVSAHDGLLVLVRAEHYLFPDGRVAACCNHHTADEAATAFVLAERTLRFRTPAVPAPRIGESPCRQ